MGSEDSQAAMKTHLQTKALSFGMKEMQTGGLLLCAEEEPQRCARNW